MVPKNWTSLSSSASAGRFGTPWREQLLLGNHCHVELKRARVWFVRHASGHATRRPGRRPRTSSPPDSDQSWGNWEESPAAAAAASGGPLVPEQAAVVAAGPPPQKIPRWRSAGEWIDGEVPNPKGKIQGATIPPPSKDKLSRPSAAEELRRRESRRRAFEAAASIAGGAHLALRSPRAEQ